MPATIVNVPAFNQVHTVVNQAVEDNKGKDVYVYFYASIDPNTGKSWCPDCVISGPLVEEVFSKHDNLVLVNVDVGDRPTWKDLNHPLRHDEVVKIKAVPTLVHWSTKSQLVEVDCEDTAKLEKFLQRS
ncbi:Thioredoxin domain-containing protein 17 [Dissophora globulifera]|nr:Thioredoxin domain-containing protein 17 [Dissophora globulifera]